MAKDHNWSLSFGFNKVVGRGRIVFYELDFYNPTLLKEFQYLCQAGNLLRRKGKSADDSYLFREQERGLSTFPV